MKRCPKCSSTDVEIIDEEMGFIKCNRCGYNELEEDLSTGEERESQREKAKFSPYRQSGGRRK